MAKTKKFAVRKKEASVSKKHLAESDAAQRRDEKSDSNAFDEDESYTHEEAMKYFRQTDTVLGHIYNDHLKETDEELEDMKNTSESGKDTASKTSVKKKKHKKKTTHRQRMLRGLAIAICIVTVIALAVVAGGWMIIRHYYGITNYVPDDDVTIYSPSELVEIEGTTEEAGEVYVLEDETDENGDVVGSTYKTVNKDEVSPEEWESIQESIANQLEDLNQQQSSISEIPVASSDHVYNLLLIGVDVRAGQSWNGNSDTMILISINTNTKSIYMTSFMRDLYTNIPGVGVDKLNKAHAVGGGPLVVQSIEENYRIHIDNYASVNFYSLISIIDALGGIDLTISADEASVANMYIRDMCKDQGISPDAYYLGGGGTLHLNGMQAVAYARIRYVGNADFGRTERQRMVLMQMFAQLQSNPSQVTTFLNAVLPLVTHNMTQDTVTTLILNAPSYLSYNVICNRIPFDGTYTYAGEMLVPDFNYTISALQSIIYQ